jgi:hypothetical protein
MFIPVPDFYPSRIPDPTTATKERGEKKLVVKAFFVATNLSLSSKKYGFGIRDPGSGKNLFRIPDPGSGFKKAPDPGSGYATLSKIFKGVLFTNGDGVGLHIKRMVRKIPNWSYGMSQICHP